MRPKIHPKYYPQARVSCACGNVWVTGSTKETIKTDVCSKCHPFFTGQSQRLVDAGGQIDRFSKRVDRAKMLGGEVKQRAAARAERARARALVEIVDEEEAVQPIEGATES